MLLAICLLMLLILFVVVKVSICILDFSIIVFSTLPPLVIVVEMFSFSY